ncbi:MAG: pirin family protein [Brachybacterium sp.]|nr:pirin family protein [Brachybacterium sp.]
MRDADIDPTVPLVLPARAVPLGGPRGMTVHRTLPARHASLVGAWCFVDHFGPDDLSEGAGMRVARHPHTGLATVSWLFAGALTHRDSLGSHALVTPGEVDLMVAGYGISHSEYSTADTTVLHGVQLWYALPERARHRDREFLVHRTREQSTGRARLRVGLGAAHLTDDDGQVLADESPVATDTALHLAEITLEAGARVTAHLREDHEYAVLIDHGPVRLAVDGEPVSTDPVTAEERALALLPAGTTSVEITGTEPDRGVRLLLIGGEPLGEDIVMWWNFVGRSHEEIERHRARYQAEIGAEDTVELPPLDPATRAAGLPADAEQFGPFAADTPPAIPAPALPHARLRPRGRGAMAVPTS